MTFHGFRLTNHIFAVGWSVFYQSILSICCISIGVGGQILAVITHFESIFCISVGVLSVFVVSVLALVVGCWHLGNLWTVCQLSPLRPGQTEK